MKLDRIRYYSKNRHYFLQLLTVVFLGSSLVVFLGFILRSWLDQKIDQKIEEAVKKEVTDSKDLEKKPPETYSKPLIGFSEQDNKFIAGSFSDTFSGTGWLTSVDGRQDNYTTGITPIPDFDLIPVAKPILPDSGRQCPQNYCLLVSDKKTITANGLDIDLPKFTGQLVSLNLHPLSNGWVLGLTSKEGELFKGWVFVFNGKNFVWPTGVNGPIFESRYSGTFGFAGSFSHWLAFYGSYEGRIYEFSNNKIFDVSYLVNPKAMRGGFIPKVFFVGSNWFVSNVSGGFPFFKFFTSNNGLVVGGLYLADLLDQKFPEDLRSLRVEEVNNKLFLELTGPSTKSFWFEMLDRGFSYPEKFQIVSRNLRAGQAQDMGRARLEKIAIYPETIKPKLFLANSSGNWLEAKIGEWFYFPQNGQDLYWQADFSGIREPFFFDLVRVEYGLNK